MAGYSGCSSNCKSTMADSREHEFPATAGPSNQQQSEVLPEFMEMDDKKNAVGDSEDTEDAEETEDEDSVNMDEAEYRASVALFAEINDNYQRLKRDLNDWEQDEMTCDLEISRLPERRGEDLVRIVIMLGDYLGVRVVERHIDFAIRMGIRWYGEAQETRPDRRVLVRLASRRLRDTLLRAVSKRRNLTTSDLGLPGAPQRIYFSERLTHVNRRLFRMARTECRNKGWRYLWIKHGRIYVRKDKRSNIYAIRTEDNIHRAFQMG